jgi:hypothetical protein
MALNWPSLWISAGLPPSSNHWVTELSSHVNSSAHEPRSSATPILDMRLHGQRFFDELRRGSTWSPISVLKMSSARWHPHAHLQQAADAGLMVVSHSCSDSSHPGPVALHGLALARLVEQPGDGFLE